MRNHLFLPALAAGLLLTGCATPAYVSPVEVTRFTGQSDQFLGTGTIQIVPAPGLDAESIEYGFYEDAVRVELEQLGYRVVLVNGGQVAQIAVDEYVSAPAGRRSPVSVGAGGSTGSYGSGVGLGIGFNLGGQPSERIEREVAVAIRPGDGGQNLWEGRASMTATANSDFAAASQAAPRIVDALFSGFPGTSGETIAVE